MLESSFEVCTSCEQSYDPKDLSPADRLCPECAKKLNREIDRILKKHTRDYYESLRDVMNSH